MMFSTLKCQPTVSVMRFSHEIKFKAKFRKIVPNQTAELVIVLLSLSIKGIRVISEMSPNSKQTKLSTLVGKSVTTVIS